MLKSENKHDQKKFDALKGNEERRGRDEQSAAKIAAKEVKELRKAEGRSKED